MNQEVIKEIRRAVDTGKAFYGVKEANKKILKDNVKIIILSNNINEQDKEYLENNAKIKKIPLYKADVSGVELGSVCGKPFSANSIIITELGKSALLEIIGAKNETK